MTDSKKVTRLKRYRLTFPFSGNKIYESKSFGKAVKGCYKEFKQLSDITEGMFMVTELGSKTTFQFQVNDKKIEQVKNKSDKKHKTNKNKKSSSKNQNGGLSTDYMNAIPIHDNISTFPPNRSRILNSQHGGLDDSTSVQSIKNEILQLEQQIEHNKINTNSDINTSAHKIMQSNIQNKIDDISIDNTQISLPTTSISASALTPISSSIMTPSLSVPIHTQNDSMRKMIDELNDRIVVLENLNKQYKSMDNNIDIDDITNVAHKSYTNSPISIGTLEMKQPATILPTASLKLPMETDEEQSYADVQNIQPTTHVIINPDDVYKSNEKKLDAINGMDNLEKTDKKCVIM